MSRKPLKVSGLISAGKIHPQQSSPTEAFGAPSGTMAIPAGPAPNDEPPVPSGSEITVLVDLIDDSPYQVRQLYDPAEIDNLAHTLATAGQQEPIIVRPKAGGRWELIAGHRRTRAARSLGWTTMKALVRHMDDIAAESATMVANEARQDLTDYERAKLYQRALHIAICSTQTEVANYFGTSQSFVSKCLRMLELPTFFINLLESRPDAFGTRAAATVFELLKEHPKHADLVEQAVMRIVNDGASQDSIKSWFLQMMRQRNEVKIDKHEAVITDHNGRRQYTIKLSGRDVVVRPAVPTMASSDVMERIINALKAGTTQ